jgi:hypothetical protein
LRVAVLDGIQDSGDIGHNPKHMWA